MSPEEFSNKNWKLEQNAAHLTHLIDSFSFVTVDIKMSCFMWF